MVSRVCCHGKHCCSSGVTECGSLVAQVDSRTHEKTWRCILVQAIGTLRLAVVVLCIRKHPNQGVTMKKKEIWQGIARCYPRFIGGEVGFPGEGEECSGLSPDCRGEELKGLDG
jgi:hypothetical protein